MKMVTMKLKSAEALALKRVEAPKSCFTNSTSPPPPKLNPSVGLLQPQVAYFFIKGYTNNFLTPEKNLHNYSNNFLTPEKNNCAIYIYKNTNATHFF